MAEYIDRKKVENITWQEPYYHDPINVLSEVRDKVRELTTADVIEREVHDKEVASLYNQLDMWQSEHANRVLELGHLREKIDNAIEEIEQEMNSHIDSDGMPDEYAYCFEFVLGILKKHIDVEVEEC